MVGLPARRDPPHACQLLAGRLGGGAEPAAGYRSSPAPRRCSALPPVMSGVGGAAAARFSGVGGALVLPSGGRCWGDPAGLRLPSRPAARGWFRLQPGGKV